MTDPDELEKFAGILEESGDYKILRRLKPCAARTSAGSGDECRNGLFVDVETTGLDPNKDEIIELAMVPFRYSLGGDVIEVLEPFDRLREPSTPIPPAVTVLTGITDEMVAGKQIDPSDVSEFAASADLVVAHNAAFDRRFLERFCPSFCRKPWACSMAEIDWAAEGFEGTKLAYLAAGYGFFYDRHRAVNDCLAAVELLARTLPRSGFSGLASLLERARQTTWRIWAANSPFELKDTLKARGYRWNADDSTKPRAWYVDVPDDQKDIELEYLWREIYKRQVELDVTRITAVDRYSDRV
ncbi:3'-5' exonuclease [Psychromarinibacter sp. C21-152]|uniref:3'-5' exonuclease n=1 Tax=Psychromarinibacter sediminicola TaxID=3033385 RepID=A0AAE3NTJ1_9RHOB|nr:3'-5' exonuclease [Psychromarinibacter sediminicola]MDF0602164.1 3'-5' exonuclease [Psychromarinibacter sediminicola]